MKIIFEYMRKYKEIISYLFWGVMTTMVSWSSYSLFALLLKNQGTSFAIMGVHTSMVVLVSNILSWICAVLFAFVTNKLWVFCSKSWEIKVFVPEFGKFISTRLVTGVLEIVLVPLLVGIGLNQTILGIEGMAAKVAVSVLIVVLNYIFSKIFIFKS
ncbi:MAG: GtrA family protein [Lachnospiraceae bacterium]|nr:GtrA family protein [Lachnospiraceae bacterium]